MDLRLEGRHALLFDDDAASAFINSSDALVPWCGDPALLIDRYDVRHLLDRIPPRPPRRASNRLAEDLADGGVTASQLDHERYLDLLPSTGDAEAISVATSDDAREISSGLFFVKNLFFSVLIFSCINKVILNFNSNCI